ncbi:hypothetical protein [Lentzea sp. NPDC003310]|uniref:hypothetical protein n=1 Tax=Lentzea sp. NPDC003310 TaxID=3154447 RepID=UPI0033B9BAA4
MTALAPDPVGITATCVLVDLGDCGVAGVRWAASCAEALGVGLVVHAGEHDASAHAAVAALPAEHAGLSVHVEHGHPTARWEGALVVVSRESASAVPPLAGRDLRDVVVLGGTGARDLGVVTAVLGPVGSGGVLRRAIAFCRARRSTRLRLLSRPHPGSRDALDEAVALARSACPGVVVEPVRSATWSSPADLLVVSGCAAGPGEGLQPEARAALSYAPCPVLFTCS